MALNFETIQPITLDGKKCTLEINPEQRLRLQQLGEPKTEEDYKKAAEVISECFPKEKSYVAEKVPKLSSFDLSSLIVYLTRGKGGIDTMRRQVDRAMDKMTDEKLENDDE